MAELSYPSPTYNARAVTEAEYEHINARSTDDGIHGDPTGAPVVTAGIGLQVLVRADAFGVVRGFAWTSGTTDVPLTVAGNSSGSTRYDWVVLRLDRATWNVRAAVLQGTPGSGSPALTQDPGPTGVWEIALALVTVPNGAASVSVTPWTQYVGARIRPANSNRVPSHSELGEIFYHPDTGEWRGWNGSSLQTIHSDSGDITLSGAFSTWEQRDDCIGRRVGAVCSLRLSYRRIESTFHSSDATGSRLAILPETLTPRWYQYFDVSFGNGAIATVRVQNDGEVWIEAPSKDVDVNRVMRQTATYLK